MKRIFQHTIIITLLFSFVFISGCSFTKEGCSTDSIIHADEKLNVGDRVWLVYEPHPSKGPRDIATIDRDGMIFAPLLGKIKISGLTAAQATQMLRTLYVERSLAREAPPFTIVRLSPDDKELREMVW